MTDASLFKKVDRENLLHPPDEIAGFVRRMARRTYRGVDNREKQRHTMGMQVVVQPVDEDLHPTGQPFLAIVRDISTEGIGLYHTREVESERLALALKIPGAKEIEMHVVMKVLRCRRIHDSLFDIGGEFICRINDPNDTQSRSGDEDVDVDLAVTGP